MRSSIRFLRKGKVAELADIAPTDTLLDYLRLTERSMGTKEGCAEGDCGACTIALGRLDRGGLRYQPVNSCIFLLGQVDGSEVVAVDDLAEAPNTLHPVQEAMVKHHGSQCGFCTPGFVMSLFSLYHADARPSRSDVNDWLAGNLCRCTGYRPIVDAALASCRTSPADRYAERKSETEAHLKSLLSDGDDVFIGNDDAFLAIPASVDGLDRLYAAHPEAILVAGATDVGLWITKQLRALPKIICLHRAGLDFIEATEDALIIGSAATYAAAQPHLAAIDPDLGEILRRLGSKQVRSTGTIGGNIANGSPIGDTPPVLIALGATVELRRAGITRQMPLEEFFLAYGKQDRAPGEFLTRIIVPRLARGQHLRCYKVSKRFDQDISALLGAFRFDIDEGRIMSARIAFGGMAATPKRAFKTESAIVGLPLADERQWRRAAGALAEDYRPISDHRASAAYRMATAQALLEKARREIAVQSSRHTRVVGQREALVGRLV
jgi:xanthine dehydrogenase small subunit